MKKIILFLFMVLAYNTYAQHATYAPGRLIITFAENVLHTEPADAGGKTGIPVIDALNITSGCTKIHAIKKSMEGYGGVYVLDIEEQENIPLLAEKYMATGYLKSASPDYTGSLQGSVPNDMLFAKQWSLDNDGSLHDLHATAGADIDMLRAWDVEDGDTSVIVAVIDAGSKPDHPDFQGRLWRNANEIPFNNMDDDNNGYIDDTLGWNFYRAQNDVIDSNGHGTHVSGIIGANADNTLAYAGVDKHCKLMLCKMTNNQGLYQYSWILEAIYYAADMGAHVMNISAGSYGFIPEMQDAIDYAYQKNIVVVAAMGNNATKSKMYPAACKHVISVGATNAMDTVAYFSNYGDHISVVAPGEHIYGLSYANDTAANTFYNGTSQATPHVAGIASLLLAQDKTRSADAVKALIENNAEDMVGSKRDLPGWDPYYGYGRVNAYRTLTNAALAIDEVNPEVVISIYPNPAHDYVQVMGEGEMEITLQNTCGQVVFTGKGQDGCQVDLRPYARGLYLFSAKRGQQVFKQKLVLE